MPTSTVAAVALHQRHALFRRSLDADGDEHPVGLAALGQRLHAVLDGLGLGVDRVGRAEFARRDELLRLDVDGDDRIAARDSRALDGVEPDAAAADHHGAGSGLDVGGVEDRAEAGHHAAGDQRGDVELDVPGRSPPPGRRRRGYARRRRRCAVRGRAACRRRRGAGSAGRAGTPLRRRPARPRRRRGRSRSCGSGWRRRGRRASAGSRRPRPPRPRRLLHGHRPRAVRPPRRRRCRGCRYGRSRRRRS